ncbi:MAG TPA: HPr family phosphocarrier protein [Symbiobacteriaceae bacterium]
MVELKVTLPTTLHARPAAMLVAVAKRFAAQVQVGYNGIFVDVQSIMGLMALRAPAGASLTVLADGPEARQAAVAVAQRLQEPFSEQIARE